MRIRLLSVYYFRSVAAVHVVENGNVVSVLYLRLGSVEMQETNQELLFQIETPQNS